MQPQNLITLRFCPIISVLFAISMIAVGQVSEATAQPLGSEQPAQPPSTDENVVTLGQPCGQPYVVAVPTSDVAILERVQAIVPTAFLTDSRLGRYVHAGSSERRSQSNALNRQLRRQGLDARVIYRPARCGSN